MKPTDRFSSRVDDYIKYRPGYPAAIIRLLEEKCQLSRASVVADIGSGTGILAEIFLKHGNSVWSVEPNREMREAGQQLLSAYKDFRSINGSAEATGLPTKSVDFVTAAQAFHWFDRVKARAEFQRILKPTGWVVLIWNDRRVNSSEFLMEYEQLLLRYGTDYQQVNHRQIDETVISSFFSPEIPHKAVFDNFQHLDFEGLKGRLLSSSYIPEKGHPNYRPMLDKLAEVFQKHAHDGAVTVEYDTLVYAGQLR